MIPEGKEGGATELTGEKTLNILLIGNSHTYYNDMPERLRKKALASGWSCRVVMIAHGGWYLAQHAPEPEVRFNILYGGYDYVVLQEHAHPFGPEEKFLEAARALNGMIRQAGSVPVIYEVWAMKTDPETQPCMNAVHERVAGEIGALLAPVGRRWRERQEESPDTDLFAEDGRHASEAGSDFAAECIWETIFGDLSAGKGQA